MFKKLTGIVMKDLVVQDGVVIPEQELEITTSRSGGPGGQHVNKTDSRITVRWNILATTALSEEQKVRVLAKLGSRVTSDGDLLVHHSASRSQLQNKEGAFAALAQTVFKALQVAKKRKPTKVSKAAKAKRIDAKVARGGIKKLRSNRGFDE